MPTSMMDALAHEQVEIAKLMAESSRLSIEALRRATLLRHQLEHLADEERNRFITTVSNLAISRSEGYSGNQPPATDPTTPEFHPQAQDGEEGNQGSGAVASGGARALDVAEPEQAVADAASGGRSGHRADPEADPDSYIRRLDKTLDLYAKPEGTVRTIAAALGVTVTTVEAHIRSGRANGDPRAAKGDHLRDVGTLVETKPPKRKFQQPYKPEVSTPSRVPEVAVEDESATAEKPPGDLLMLDLKDCRASYDGQTIQLIRWEFRIVHVLNSQVPMQGLQMLSHCSVLSLKSLRRDINKLNPRLAQISVRIVELVGDHFQLQPFEPSP